MAIKTANEELLDALVRHQVYTLRYSAYVRNRMIEILNKSEEAIAATIRDKLRNNAGFSSPQEVKRLQSLMAGIEGLRRPPWEEAKSFLEEEAIQLSYNEPIQLNGFVQTVLPVTIETVLPHPRQLKAIATARPFQGRLLKEWAERLEDDDIRRIHNAIQAGMVAGEGSDAIARRVVGSARLSGIDGVTEMTRAQVQGVVRTAVQHISNASRDAWMAENSDILQAERFVATLDSRTTPVCMANDGKTFPVGKGPRPPLHFQCRSLRVPFFDTDIVGERPANPTTEKILVNEYAKKNGLSDVTTRESLPRGHRGSFDDWARARKRELIGPIPSSETYQTWLGKQSVTFQKDVLGSDKQKLFSQGGLKLDQFVDRNGTPLTLKELAAKHAEAFRAAGLEPANF